MTTMSSTNQANDLKHLVLGTHNRKKRAELEELLRPHGFVLRSLVDFDHPLEVVEDGKTFGEIATKKATEQACHLGAWVLGEDSGLVVDALGGAPGIYSARFSGQNADDDANNRQLLDELRDVPDDKRNAHYVCHLTLSDPDGTAHIDCEAICRGRIRRAPAGTGGFGYDPLFELPEYHRTFGQLGGAAKSVLSHRARAIRLFVPQVLRLLGELETASG